MGDDPLSSDHLPIIINITGVFVRERNAPQENVNYDKADWFSFRAELGALPVGDHGSLSIDALSPFLIGRMFLREPSWKYSAKLVGS